MTFKIKNGLFKIIMVVAIAMFSILGVFTENTNARENENLEEIALMEDSLELIYEKGVVTNEKGYFLGYDREVFETVLSKYDDYEEFIQRIEDEGLFVTTNQFDISEKPQIGTRAAACGWHLMRPKAEFTAAQNQCIYNGLTANYGYISLASTIANLIADKEFKLAAEKIVKLGLKSNIWGVITTLTIIQVECAAEMDKKFPGKSNCE
ncbi:hypothetical protein [Lysinibacillus sphaericus]|uniref:hypothetical protein n=1 Tax=Lysinibacillus sphaericus TaxID=1421 RepID=UPI000C196926|nr:hypothetical protein [Lysinibacillus sphaericus]PIJ97361.1 hypothetical protein CTN02_14515 [Lysinibacillus sphaericus]QPA53443.1 hypothetical protein INQ53_16575 [Lysinibacillus sphaericus]